MTEFFAVTFSYPTVLFTMLLGVVVVYWTMVIVGALGIDVFDFHTHDATHGAAEGVAHGAVEGATHGAAEAAAHGAAEGVGLGAHHGAHEGGHGLVGGVLHTLNLRNAPMSLVLSLMLLFSWLFSHAASTMLQNSLASIPVIAWGTGVAVLSMAVSLPVTSLVVRPLGRMLKVEKQTSRSDIVGKIVMIDTSRVDERFGVAKLVEGGNAFLIQVRCEGENTLTRGARAVVLNYDEGRHAYEVSPYDELVTSSSTPP